MAQTLDDVLAQIETLKKQADVMIANEKAAVIAEMKEKVAKYKITAAELGLFSTVKPIETTPKKVVAPKYMNPMNPSQTWTGRGRRPTWFVELEASGESEEYYTIKK
jgi:DNA-binding protein H-NS